MEPSEAIATLRAFNAWRRCDEDSFRPDPAAIGQALDALCDHAERTERELEQERQDRKQSDLDTIRALGERNEARAEIAVWKHESKRLDEQLKAMEETAIEWWCEYQDLKAKVRRDLSEIDRELDACVARSARDWRPLPGDPDEPGDANRLQTETDDQAGDTA